MKEIKWNPAPHVEIRIQVTEKMEKDFKECQETFIADPDNEKDCGRCSWNCIAKEGKSSIRLCVLPNVQEKMREVLNGKANTKR